MAENEHKKTPRDVLRLILPHRRMFLLGASLFAIAALLGAHRWPLEYAGTTKFQRRSDAAAEQIPGTASESFENIKLTLQQDLAGRNAVEAVAKELGLTAGLPHDSEGNLTRDGEMAKQQIVRKLIESITIRWEVRSPNRDLVSVSVTHSDARLAQLIPDTLVKNYVQNVSEEIRRRLGDSHKFLLDNVGRCRTRLTELMGKKIDFETERAGTMPESPGALQEIIQQDQADIRFLERLQKTARLKLAGFERLRARAKTARAGTAPSTRPATAPSTRPATSPSTQPATAPSTGPATPAGGEREAEPLGEPIQVVKGPNPELKRLKDELRDYEQRLDGALVLNHMTEKHPTVKTLRSKIAALNKQIEATPAIAVLHTVYATAHDWPPPQGLEADMIAAQAELDAAAGELERKRGLLAAREELMRNFAPVRRQWLDIVEEVEKERAELGRWESRLTGVQMALAAEMAQRRTDLRTVQTAQEQVRPSSPALARVLGLALIGGLGFGGGLVFLSNFMSHAIGTSEEAVKYFDVPVHGVISEIVSRRQRRANWVKRWVLGPVVTVIVLAGLSASAFSITLRLMYPRKYEQWKAAPVEFVHRRAVEAAGRLPGLF